jgi:chromosome segregation protein
MEERDRWPGIIGTVAESFVPRAGMEVAVESSLGELARFIVCKDRSTAEQVIARLRAEKKGKIGILVPQTGTINPAVKRPEINLPGFVGWLDDFVSCDESLRPLMQAVLSHTAVFSAGSDPSELLKHLPYGFKAVSEDGLVYTSNSVTGGSDGGIGLFRRKEKLDEQKQLTEELTAAIERLRTEKSRVVADIASARAQSAEMAANLEQMIEELTVLQQTISSCEFQKGSLEKEIARLNRELGSYREKLETLTNRQYSLGLDFNQLSSRKEALVSSLTEDSDELSSLEKTASDAPDHLSPLQTGPVEARGRVEQTESRIRHLTEIASGINESVHTNRKEIEESQATITQSTERIESLEGGLKETFDARNSLNDEQRKLQGSAGDVKSKVTDRETGLRRLRSEKEQFSEQIHKLEIRSTTRDAELNSLIERATEEYDIDLREIEVDCPDSEISTEQARANLVELRDRLKKFGVVNLLAMEEYKQAFEREQFLGEQLEDLEKAKTDLKDTISRINQTARELFNETFAKVQTNFQKLFIELFSGGEAAISLTDASDPLESDIEIVARPRGKKILSITMMSGGERALTAISLLFALYLVKPSPFCILDEIDAPLDDANCHRFLSMIKSFSAQTQFITITHNKITMEAADNLYGVTMEQPGVSKLVGVRFNDGLMEAEDAAELVAEGLDGELPKSIADRLNSDVAVTTDDEPNE